MGVEVCWQDYQGRLIDAYVGVSASFVVELCTEEMNSVVMMDWWKALLWVDASAWEDD